MALVGAVIARGSYGAVDKILNGEYDEEMEKRREEERKAREDMLSSLATAGISAQSVKELLATFEQARATFGEPIRTVNNELIDAVFEQFRSEEQERRELAEQKRREQEEQEPREQEEPEQHDEIERVAQEYIDERELPVQEEQEPIDKESSSSLRPGDDYDEHALPPSTEARTVTVSINSEDGDLQPGFDVWCDGEKVASSQASRSGGGASEKVTLRGDCSVSAWSVTGGGRYELTIKED